MRDQTPPEVREVQATTDAVLRLKDTARDELLADLRLIKKLSSRSIERVEGEEQQKGPRLRWPWH